MAQPLSYEDSESVFFITTRTQASRLWLINNPQLEYAVLSYLAKYQEVYGVILYAFIIMGNHYHLVARFPKCNKARFMRSFNSIFAKLVQEHVKGFKLGRVWGRRYSCQALPLSEDVQHWSIYCALNPLSSGICRDATKYKGYNSFSDSRNNIVRKFKVFDRKKYNDKIRYAGNSSLSREDYTTEYSLKYSVLPGLEKVGRKMAVEQLDREYDTQRKSRIAEREANGLGFADSRYLANLKVGAFPKKTKTSSRYSRRPLVLTKCMNAKKRYLDFYFSMRAAYIAASIAYRAGERNVQFPPGTYPPSLVSVP